MADSLQAVLHSRRTVFALMVASLIVIVGARLKDQGYLQRALSELNFLRGLMTYWSSQVPDSGSRALSDILAGPADKVLKTHLAYALELSSPRTRGPISLPALEVSCTIRLDRRHYLVIDRRGRPERVMAERRSPSRFGLWVVSEDGSRRNWKAIGEVSTDLAGVAQLWDALHGAKGAALVKTVTLGGTTLILKNPGANDPREHLHSPKYEVKKSVEVEAITSFQAGQIVGLVEWSSADETEITDTQPRGSKKGLTTAAGVSEGAKQRRWAVFIKTPCYGAEGAARYDFSSFISEVGKRGANRVPSGVRTIQFNWLQSWFKTAKKAGYVTHFEETGRRSFSETFPALYGATIG